MISAVVAASPVRGSTQAFVELGGRGVKRRVGVTRRSLGPDHRAPRENSEFDPFPDA